MFTFLSLSISLSFYQVIHKKEPVLAAATAFPKVMKDTTYYYYRPITNPTPFSGKKKKRNPPPP